MRTNRNLSGIYFRAKNEKQGKYESVVFEELTEEEQDAIMMGRSEEWLKSLAKSLSKTIATLGNQFDLTTSEDES